MKKTTGKTMKKHSGKNGKSLRVLGLDIGDTWSHWCEVDESENVTESGRMKTSREEVRTFFAPRPRTRVVLETGAQSAWIARELTEAGHEVIVANPRRLALVTQNVKKTDHGDAELLAQLGRTPKLLSPVRPRSESSQRALAAIRARSALVEARTKLVNTVRALLKGFGIALAKSSTPAFVKKAAPGVPPGLAPSVQPLLDSIEALSRQIAAMDREVERRCEKDHPVTAQLRQVAGVGALTALTYVLTLDDPQRFKKSRDVGPYLGLVPRRKESGQRNPQLGITKAGNPYLRKLLTQAAHYVLGPFGPKCDLRTHGEKIAARGGKNAKKRALTAVARKLAVLLHRLWVTGEVYQPVRTKPAEAATAAA